MERLFTLGLTNAAIATVLALVVALLSRRLGDRPGWLHCLWLLVLVKLVTPPLYVVPVPRLNRPEAIPVPIAVPATVAMEVPIDLAFTTTEPGGFAVEADADETPAATFSPPASFHPLPALWAVWLAGSVLVLALAGVRVARFRRLLSLALPADDDVQDLVSDLAARLGLARVPAAWTVDAAIPPLLWAVGGAPRLVLPRHLWKRLDACQRRLLLVHELAHLKRRDHLVRLFELAVTAAFWWLPTAWWARKALRDAEEDCCDAWVVWAFPDDAREYAETLLDTVDFLTPPRPAVPLLASGFGGTHHLDLQRRLTMIMQGTTPRRLSLAGTLGAFGLSACLLPLTPGWAQPPAEKSESQAITFTVTSDDDAKPGQDTKVETKVGVAIAVDGEVEEVKADSVSKAVDALKSRIDELAKDKGSAEKHAAQIKALKEAVAGLEKAKANTFIYRKVEGQDATAKAIEQKRSVVVLRAKADARDQAKIEKARERVRSIQQDLARKQKELAEANRELAKLAAVPHIVVDEVASPSVVVGQPLKEQRIRVLEKKIAAQAGQSFDGKGQHFALELKPGELKNHVGVEVRSLSDQRKDQDRIAALERKLSELLKEVEGLRKQREHKAEAK